MKKMFYTVLILIVTAFCCFSCGNDNDTNNEFGAGNQNGNGIEKHTHSFGAYLPDGNATCTSDGTKTAYCSGCDESVTIKDVGSKKGHNYNAGYQYDSVNHWLECGNCEYVSDVEEHLLVDGWCSVCKEIIYTDGLEFTYDNKTDTYSVTGYSGTAYNLIVCSVYEGKPVTCIDSGAFINCDVIRSIYLPNSIKSIGEEAFSGCYNLESVYNLEGITEIGAWAFYYCSNLKDINIPYGVKKIEKETFFNCGSITSIIIPDSVQEIGENAFYQCYDLVDVTIGCGVDIIGPYAFFQCNSLENVHISDVASWCGISFDGYGSNPINYSKKLCLENEAIKDLVIPNGTTKISDTAFQNCLSLVSVSIPNSVMSIGDSAFEECQNIETISIEDGVEEIGKRAFYGCSKLKGIEMPSSVQEIGEYAFYSCTSLEELAIGSNVNNINDFTFYSCESLKKLVIPNSVKGIGNYAFAHCEGITDVTFGENLNSIGKGAFSLCYGLTNLIIGNGVTSIGESAFECCYIISVTLPQSIVKIESEAFANCFKLIEVVNNSKLNLSIGSTSNGGIACYAKEIHTGKSKLVNKNDLLFYSCEGSNYLLGYTGNEMELSLPDSYNGQKYEIYDYAFHRKSKLLILNIGNGVTSIGRMAFYKCHNLRSVTLGSSLSTINYNAFQDCYKLVEVINNSKLALSAGSYENGWVAANAIEVHSGKSKLDYIDDYIFYVTDDNIILVAYIGDDTVLILPNDYKGNYYSIGENAFRGNNNISSVSISNYVTGIGAYAFSDLDGLIEVTIGNGVRYIEKNAFSGCQKLQKVNFKNANRWVYKTGRYSSSDISISSEYLKDSETAAYYLTVKYSDYYWENQS